MADCFCLPNVERLAEALRICARMKREHDDSYYNMTTAADAIEQFAKDIDVLTKENAKLKAERDTAVADLKDLGYCSKCLHENKYPIYNPCCVCQGNMWEWRGIKEEEDGKIR